MKRTINKISILTLVLGLVVQIFSFAQEEKATLNVSLNYFSKNNLAPFITVKVMSKVDGKKLPVKGTELKLYLDSVTSDATFIGKIITDEKGNGTIGLPQTVQQVWKNNAHHTIIAKSDADKKYDESETTLEITKSRLVIDTTNDGETKNVVIKVFQLQDSNWVPMPGVELKVGVARLGSVLPVGDAENYTTDSIGVATAEFKRSDLPGDEKGNIVLVAQVDGNETIGSVVTEFNVKWGVPSKHDNLFFDRALWGSRSNAPFWLIGASNLIILGVWGVLFFTIWRIYLIYKMGKSNS